MYILTVQMTEICCCNQYWHILVQLPYEAPLLTANARTIDLAFEHIKLSKNINSQYFIIFFLFSCFSCLRCYVINIKLLGKSKQSISAGFPAILTAVLKATIKQIWLQYPHFRLKFERRLLVSYPLLVTLCFLSS